MFFFEKKNQKTLAPIRLFKRQPGVVNAPCEHSVCAFQEIPQPLKNHNIIESGR